MAPNSVLVESRGESGGTTRVVVGVGINWRLPAGALDGLVEQPHTDLASLPVALPSRDAVVAQLLNTLVLSLDEFAVGGFAAFRGRWEARDVLRGRRIVVHLDRETVAGTALGIDGEGALRVDTTDGERRFTGGEVSVREDA